LRQIARIDQHGLNDTQSAADIWLQLVKEDESDGRGLLALATLETDIRRRWDWRAQHAQLLPPREAALSLCALAELADDHHIYRDRIADLYREARRLDPECAPAAEAVKGIGRRLGRLRPAAALLQDDQEATWTAAARAIRLIELARQSPIGSDSARDLYGRALALDPDQVEAWRGASAATQAAGDTQQASRLLLQAVHAWHRTHAPDGQAAGVDLMVEAAELARVAVEVHGEELEEAQVALRAWGLPPLWARGVAAKQTRVGLSTRTM
jgi:tetratricopeptide (TPR) repeat protein